MSLTARDITLAVGTGLRAEVQFCRDQCVGLLNALPVPKKASEEAPWLASVAFLTFAKSAATVFSTAAAGAFQQLAVPIWLFEQTSKSLGEIYKRAASVEQQGLELAADKMRTQISQQILAAERNFYGSKLGREITQKLESLAADRRSAMLYSARSEKSVWVIAGLARDLIHRSKIMVVDHAEIKAAMRHTFEEAFEGVHQLFLASPLAGDFARAKQNIFHVEAFLAGDGSISQFNRAYSQLRELDSLGDLEHICREKRQSFLSSRCTSAFTGARIKGRDGFLYIMTNADAFEIRVRDQDHILAGGGVVGSASNRTVEVVPIVPNQQSVGFLAHQHLKGTLEALDRAYDELLREVRRP